MNEEIIEQQLTNVIGRYDNGEPFNEVQFTVTSWQGRNFLYMGTPSYGKRIAECVNGDYQERYGDITGWLRYILKREQNRIEVIKTTVATLNSEFANRVAIIRSINDSGIN